MMSKASMSSTPTSELAVPTHARPRLTLVLSDEDEDEGADIRGAAEPTSRRGRRVVYGVGALCYPARVSSEFISRGLVLAAGLGSRLREGGVDLPKPLQVVAGRTLLDRTVSTLAAAGLTEIWVVIGFRADEIERFIEEQHPAWRQAGVEVRTIANRDFERSNGVSVLCADGVVPGAFVLSMSDHVYDTSVARAAATADMQAGDLWLCVDRRIGEVYDPDDATKVRTVDGRIVDISKTLPAYDCIDCGVFAVGPALLASLRAERERRGDCSLSDGVRHLAASGRARVIDIGDAFWQDVDTPDALERAERELLRTAR
jgi:choline kinase